MKKRIFVVSLVMLLSLLLFSCGGEAPVYTETGTKTEQGALEGIPTQTLDPNESTVKGPFWIDNSGQKFICVEFVDYNQWEKKNLELAQNLVLSELELRLGIDLQFSFCEQGIPNDFNILDWEWFGDLKVKKAYQSEKMTSIVLEGSTNHRGAAYPLHSLVAYSFDANGKLISFEELHPVDDALYDAFAVAGEEAIKEENNGIWPEIFESFSETFCSREDFLKGLREGSIQWFYTEEGVCFSYPILHALGDHKEAIVPYSYFIS